MMNKLLFFLIAGTTLFSCCKSSNLEYALTMAGDNRTELERVLEHYSADPADSLKLRAARFLIENMPGHYSYKGDEVLEFYALGEQILASGLDPRQQRDSILKISKEQFPNLQRNTVPDIWIMQGDYLIENIEEAFDLWQNKPWAAHLDFDQFCEYLLPYKCFELQGLDHWRDTLAVRFGDALSAMACNDVEYDSPLQAAILTRKEIQAKVKPLGLFMESGYSFLGASNIHKLTYGRCTDYVNLAVATMRSLGIPVIIDGTPQWGRYRAGHDWYSLLNDKGENLASEWDVSTDPGKAFFPHERIPKVYRHTYAINRERAEYLTKAKYRHPFDLFQKDVTGEYFAADDLSIPVIRKDLEDKYVYIAVFNGHAADWNIIDYGILRRGKAEFKKMGRNMLYLAFGYDGIRLVPISDPFILHSNGQLEYIIVDLSATEDITLRRKYYQSANVVDMERRLLGGRIQAANNPNFSDAVTLYTVENLEYPDLIPLSPEKPYRYWRYLSAEGSYGSIAELQFFQEEGTPKLTGEVISSLGGNDPDGVGQRAFDGDWLTNFETLEADGSWVGLDMGHPVAVDKIRCIPRSDDNAIRTGDEYELKYWDEGEWKSFGRRVADDNRLVYSDVPRGALLWLKNHTRGWDERVFLYKNGRQEWW